MRYGMPTAAAASPTSGIFAARWASTTRREIGGPQIGNVEPGPGDNSSAMTCWSMAPGRMTSSEFTGSPLGLLLYVLRAMSVAMLPAMQYTWRDDAQRGTSEP